MKINDDKIETYKYDEDYERNEYLFQMAMGGSVGDGKIGDVEEGAIGYESSRDLMSVRERQV